MLNIPIADAHCDFLYYMHAEGWSLFAPRPRQAVALPYLQAGGVALQFFAAWVDAELRAPGLLQTNGLIDAYHRMLEQSDGTLTPLTRDFQPGQGKIATVLTIEGGEALGGSIEALRNYYRLGVRAMTLTWNFANDLASPAMRRINRGLTPLGRRVAREMCRIGMALDVAHLSDAGIDELLSLADRPIFASHSNARAICPHRRSLSDRHIKEITRAGGIVCVNFYPPQLTRAREGSTQDIARHVAHVAALAGPEHVGLGSDFDGMSVYPRDLANPGQFPALLEALREVGFSEAELRRIAYDNLRDYIIAFI